MAIDRGFGTAVEAGPIFITISDGDRGDITVSESGTVWTVSDTLTAYASAAQGALADSAIQQGDAATLTNVVGDSFQVTGGTGTEGKLTWNDTDGTLDLILKGENVTLQVGQEHIVKITNQTGGTISDGQVVYVQGSTGNHLDVGLAQANSYTTSSRTLAIVTETITNNQSGYATVLGLVRDLNTTAFAEGDDLWLSPTVAGQITNVRPMSPNTAIFLGWCVRSHASLGSIFISIERNGLLGVPSGEGLGGTVTQLTSRTTPVTIDKVSGAITLFSAVGAITYTSFTVNNSAVEANDVVVVSQKSGTNLYSFDVTAVASGSFQLTFRSVNGTATDSPVVNFTVIKSSIN